MIQILLQLLSILASFSVLVMLFSGILAFWGRRRSQQLTRLKRYQKMVQRYQLTPEFLALSILQISVLLMAVVLNHIEMIPFYVVALFLWTAFPLQLFLILKLLKNAFQQIKEWKITLGIVALTVIYMGLTLCLHTMVELQNFGVSPQRILLDIGAVLAFSCCWYGVTRFYQKT